MLLGYSKWENFSNVINKAKIACENVGHNVSDHFPDVRKMVALGSGSERDIDDVMLTRYACYLIAQNKIKAITLLRSQIATAKDISKIRMLPYAFTREGMYRGDRDLMIHVDSELCNLLR